jgi:DNA-binding transcriptional MerR regulator
MSTPENGLDLSVVAAATEIPDKLYFRIGDVARLAGIKPYVLRFWETEFPALGPKKSGTGHRLYRRKDVEMVLEIKRLLYEQRFTIEGARKFLETRAKTEAAAVKPSKRRPAKAASSSGGASAAAAASGVGPAKGQADLFGDGPSSGALELVRKELREILGLLQ